MSPTRMRPPPLEPAVHLEALVYHLKHQCPHSKPVLAIVVSNTQVTFHRTPCPHFLRRHVSPPSPLLHQPLYPK